MRKLSATIVWFLIAESVCGMSNLTRQQNNTNAEGNQVFLPVAKRRFSEGMINTVVWPAPKRQNRRKNNVCASLGQQQNGRELFPQGNASGLRLGQGYGGGLPTPIDAGELYMEQEYAGLPAQSITNGTAEFVQQEIDGNANGNMMFLPVLRSQNNRNNVGNGPGCQEIQKGSNINFPKQYSNQGYSPLAGSGNEIVDSTFNLSEVLQIAEQRSQMNVEKMKQEMDQKIANLEHQNEILKREIQYYKDRGRHFFPNKIAELEKRVISLEEHIRAQNKKHQEEAGELKDQITILEQENGKLKKEVQYYRSGSNSKFLQEIDQLKEQVKEFTSQIAKEKSKREEETRKLEEQLEKERELNLTLSLGTESVLGKK